MNALTLALSQREKGQTRRAFLRDLARLGASMAGLGALAGCAPAQPGSGPARVYRVGVLPIPGGGAAVTSPLWARMKELGYVEERNLLTIDRSGSDALADQNPLAMELARLPVDVIVVGVAASIQAAMAATTSIPIVMAGAVVDPVASRYVASIARPGGNVTGVAAPSSDLFAKRLQQLVEAAPTVSKVLVVSSGRSVAPQLPPAAQALGVTLVYESLQTREDIEPAFARAVAEGADALFVQGGTVAGQNPDLVIGLAERYRLPASYGTGGVVRAGGLMAYQAQPSGIGRRVAEYVDRILRGAKPADLPVELPTRYDFTVNMRTARTLGLTFSRDFLAQVDEVIE